MRLRPALLTFALAALVALTVLGLLWSHGGGAAFAQNPEESPVIDHTVLDNQGREVRLSDYRGTALLIVNTASQCGLTPQLETMEFLHQRYQARGFSVLAFPSNDFGGQEPGSNEEIEAFYCAGPYSSSFPIFDKIHTKGDEIAPLYRTLTEETPEELRGEITWNFNKFLVDADGRVVARFAATVDPMDESVLQAVESVLPR